MGFLKKIRIQNFKNLEDITIDVKPINLLFGANGTGKSSLMQAMMFLWKNIVPLNTNETIYQISDTTNLISYKDIVTDNDVEKDIIFELFFNGEFTFPKIELHDREFRNGFLNNLLEKKVSDEIGYLFPVLEEKNIFHFMDTCDKWLQESGGYYPEGYEELFEVVNFDFRIEIVFKNSGYDDNTNLYKVIYEDLINKSIVKYKNEEAFQGLVPVGFYFLDNESITDRFTQYIAPISNIETIDEIPPFNDVKDSRKYEFDHVLDSQPQTLYEEWGKLPLSIRLNSYHKFLQFFHLLNDYFPSLLGIYSRNSNFPSVRKIPDPVYLLKYNKFDSKDYYGILNFCSSESNLIEINNWLNNFGFDGDLKLVKEELAGALKIETKDKEFYLSHASSGLIQLLPIIVGCIKLKDVVKKQSKVPINRTYNPLYKLFPVFPNIYNFFVEQPELHLHPKLQSKSAELFTSIVSEKVENAIYIETHSEHVIKKLQVLIAKKLINKNDLLVLFFNNREGKTSIRELEVEENGFFKEPWPDGFFDDSMNLGLELLFSNN